MKCVILYGICVFVSISLVLSLSISLFLSLIRCQTWSPTSRISCWTSHNLKVTWHHSFVSSFESSLIFYGRVLCHMSFLEFGSFFIFFLFLYQLLWVSIVVKEGVLSFSLVSWCVTHNLYIPYAFIFCVSHHIIPTQVEDVYAISRLILTQNCISDIS